MAALKHKNPPSVKDSSKRLAKDDYIDDDDEEEPEMPDTVFLRNLATFDTTQESLKEYIEKNFGEAVYCLICKDKETGMSKGTAFVKFKSPETAQQCLDEFDNPECQTKFFLDGRNIFVLPALSRDKIDEVKRAKAPNVEAEDAPKKKKKPRHYRPQTKISSGAAKSRVLEDPVKKQSKDNKSKLKGSIPPRKGKQKNSNKKSNRQSNRQSKVVKSEATAGKKLKKNMKKKKKTMLKKISQISRGRH